ncbi:formimidoylglutamase [Capnocytophaga sp. ARDL2]|uniref:formimidoylglutamase n=1 Tax=Capnocytophaga sp. ARDL2 TaxID=3238809 RepID=UPI0035564AA8
MIEQYLKPITFDLELFVQKLPTFTLGKVIDKHTENHFPSLDDVQIALLTVDEFRGGDIDETELSFFEIRKNLYELYQGNWSSKIVDLGTLEAGNMLEDTYFALREICEYLLKQNILPIIIGGSQDLTYPIYRAYDKLDQMVNLVTVDNKIDIVKDFAQPSENFLTKIIMEEPTNLRNFSNLGYQTYFNSQEELDLIESMYFEAYRVGELAHDLTLIEPILRDADIVSVDVAAIKSADMGYYRKFNPNGFDGREICTITRYAGISDKVSIFGLFNIGTKDAKSPLLAQMIWYFLEGYNYRINEYPYISKKNYFKYIVANEDQDLIFYKSDMSGRWWIELQYSDMEDNERKVLFPCSKRDYDNSLKGEIPERWWKAMKKLLI